MQLEEALLRDPHPPLGMRRKHWSLVQNMSWLEVQDNWSIVLLEGMEWIGVSVGCREK